MLDFVSTYLSLLPTVKCQCHFAISDSSEGASRCPLSHSLLIRTPLQNRYQAVSTLFQYFSHPPPISPPSHFDSEVEFESSYILHSSKASGFKLIRPLFYYWVLFEITNKS